MICHPSLEKFVAVVAVVGKEIVEVYVKRRRVTIKRIETLVIAFGAHLKLHQRCIMLRLHGRRKKNSNGYYR